MREDCCFYSFLKTFGWTWLANSHGGGQCESSDSQEVQWDEGVWKKIHDDVVDAMRSISPIRKELMIRTRIKQLYYDSFFVP